MFEFLAARIAIKRPSPELIPMSLPRCSDNDFCSVQFHIPELGYDFSCKESNAKGFTGWLWVEGEAESIEATLLNSCFQKESFSMTITRYYKCAVYDYRSPLRFIMDHILRLHVVLHLRRKFSQKVFNYKRLTTADRIDLLRYMLEQTKDDHNYRTDVVSYGLKVYGERFLFHPDRRKWTNSIELVFESLVLSGELQKTNYKYKMLPKALVTISDFERNERYHLDNIANGKKINRLTLVIAVIALFSLGIELLKLKEEISPDVGTSRSADVSADEHGVSTEPKENSEALL
ncbi:hypothetical protein [Vibrio coralliilyticus]|uniref:hypothetical protein n=1 Tax=Vibrio coralliilyticus TaxID=190893 RepID=UPI00182B3631|nr:hypothetical protein [Vibrio coralliilyticus]NUW69907.1 hypothetical protein [Vibrio coralliilyticus]